MSRPEADAVSIELDALIGGYLQAVEAGNALDREEWISQHPGHAERLRAFFADLDRVENAVEPLRRDNDPTIDFSNTQGNRAQRIRYFGDYELIEEIARGGMGVVYKARQLSLNRTVALKMILKGSLADSNDIARFRAEAEAVANLDHPNIVPIYEIGEHDGMQYFSMRLIDGPPLGRVPNGTPREEAARLTSIARAVHFAHQRGVLHRDLKPSNILVGNDGAAYITDFGLAKRLDDASASLSSTGQLLGTPRYMAPEQASNKKDLSVAADVYSLGVILFERIAGRTPFVGDDVLTLLRQHRETEPPSLSSVKPGVDRDLETIARKCLDKDPVRRYRSAEALADDLDRWMHGKPIEARPVSSTERFVLWCKRNPRYAALAALVVISTLVGLGAFVVQYERTVLARKETEKALDVANTARQVAEESLYFNRITLARSQWQADNLEASRGILDGSGVGFRNWEWRYLLRQATPAQTIGARDAFAYRPPEGREIATVRSVQRSHSYQNKDGGKGTVTWGGFPVLAVIDAKSGLSRFEQDVVTIEEMSGGLVLMYRSAFHPDGKSVAFAISKNADPDAKPAVFILDAKNGARLITCKNTLGEVRALEFSPDGKTLAAATFDTGRAHKLMFWNASTGALEKTIEGGWYQAMSFSPDGKQIVSGDAVWNFQTGKAALSIPNSTLAAFAPDGKTVAGVCSLEPNSAWIWDSTTGAVKQILPGNSQPVSIAAIAFSHDGNRLATGTDQNYKPSEVRVWDLPRRLVSRRIRGINSGVERLAFRQDDRELAVVSRNEGLVLVDLEHSSESLDIRVNNPSEHDYRRNVWFSPDGEDVLSIAYDHSIDPRVSSVQNDVYLLKVWNAGNGKLRFTTPAINGPLAFRPGSHEIAVSLSDGVKIMNFQDGSVIRKLEGAKTRPDGLAYDESGKYLAAVTKGSVNVWNASDGSEIVPPEGWGVQVPRIHSQGWANNDAPYWLKLEKHDPSDQKPDRIIAFSPTYLGPKAWIDGTAVNVSDSDGKNKRKIGSFDTPVDGLTFSLDGTKIAAESAGSIKVWNVQTGNDSPVPADLEAFAGKAFGPNGERLLMTTEFFYTNGPAGASFSQQFRLDWGNGRNFSPDRQLACTRSFSGGYSRLVVRPDSGDTVGSLGSHQQEAIAAAFFPDGSRLVTGDTSGVIKLWDTKSWREVLSWQGHQGAVVDIVVDPKGRRIASFGWDGFVRVWDAGS